MPGKHSLNFEEHNLFDWQGMFESGSTIESNPTDIEKEVNPERPAKRRKRKDSMSDAQPVQIGENSMTDTVSQEVIPSNLPTIMPSKKPLWTELHPILMVGTISLVSVYTGTTSFSSKNCSIQWDAVSKLFDKALERKSLPAANKDEASMKSSYKAIKTKVRSKGKGLLDLILKFKKMNLTEKLVLEKEIESFLTTTQDSKSTSTVFEEEPPNLPRRNCWTPNQQRLLYGSILFFMAQHGSLNRTNGVPLPWTTIENTFTELCKELIDEEVPIRNPSALQRHYKEIRANMVGGANRDVYLLKRLHDEFLQLLRSSPQHFLNKFFLENPIE